MLCPDFTNDSEQDPDPDPTPSFTHVLLLCTAMSVYSVLLE